MTVRFDAIVIGTGQSGPSLARRLTEAGQKVAVIERKRFGGTCVKAGTDDDFHLLAAEAARGAAAIHRGVAAAEHDYAPADLVDVSERD
jgi:pyruvate/2-oxoglutarate dehydrogenase complex dihydrolipoamide dehydrogenase (E3) component